MNISLHPSPNSSKYLYLDTPYRQAARHFHLLRGVNALHMPTSEKVSHIVKGVLKLIPILGHSLALWDYMRSCKPLRVLELDETDPYLRGLQHGRALKKEILEVQKLVQEALSPAISDWSKVLLSISRWKPLIPNELYSELSGIACGSGADFDTLVFHNIFQDMLPGVFGCSSFVYSKEANSSKYAAITNHSLHDPITTEVGTTLARYENLKQSLEKASKKNMPLKPLLRSALRACSVAETVLSVIFDTKNKSMMVAHSEGEAAWSTFKSFSQKQLFNQSAPPAPKTSDKKVFIARNLDWHWPILAHYSCVFKRKISSTHSTVTLGYPGLLSSYTGMNSSGVALSYNSRGHSVSPLPKKMPGHAWIPTCLLLTHALDTTKNAKDCSSLICERHSTSCNLAIGDATGGEVIELNGTGQRYSDKPRFYRHALSST